MRAKIILVYILVVPVQREHPGSVTAEGQVGEDGGSGKECRPHIGRHALACQFELPVGERHPGVVGSARRGAKGVVGRGLKGVIQAVLVDAVVEVAGQEHACAVRAECDGVGYIVHPGGTKILLKAGRGYTKGRAKGVRVYTVVSIPGNEHARAIIAEGNIGGLAVPRKVKDRAQMYHCGQVHVSHKGIPGGGVYGRVIDDQARLVHGYGRLPAVLAQSEGDGVRIIKGGRVGSREGYAGGGRAGIVYAEAGRVHPVGIDGRIKPDGQRAGSLVQSGRGEPYCGITLGSRHRRGDVGAGAGHRGGVEHAAARDCNVYCVQVVAALKDVAARD